MRHFCAIAGCLAEAGFSASKGYRVIMMSVSAPDLSDQVEEPGSTRLTNVRMLCKAESMLNRPESE